MSVCGRDGHGVEHLLTNVYPASADTACGLVDEPMTRFYTQDHPEHRATPGSMCPKCSFRDYQDRVNDFFRRVLGKGA